MPSHAENALRRTYPHHDWHTVYEALDHAGADVYRLSGAPQLYVKIVGLEEHPDPDRGLRAEAERLEWLAANDIPAPRLVEYGEIRGCEYLVSSAAPGRPGSDHWPGHQRMAVMDAIADFARDLHALPVGDCPFDRGLDRTVGYAREAVARRLVDADDFEHEFRGWSDDEALAELLSTVDQIPREPEVLCHGDFCLPNVLLDPETLRVTSIVDVGRFGRADRYADLALMFRSVSTPDMNHQFGVEHAERFLQRYGEVPPDLRRVEFYRLLDAFSLTWSTAGQVREVGVWGSSDVTRSSARPWPRCGIGTACCCTDRPGWARPRCWIG